MEKELTKREALHQLSVEYAEKAKKIREKYKDVRCGRDGGETQELKKLHKEEGKRYAEIEEKYSNQHSE